MSTFGLTDKEEIAGILQAKFCAEWSLRNIFRDITEVKTRLIACEEKSFADGIRSLSTCNFKCRVEIDNEWFFSFCITGTKEGLLGRITAGRPESFYFSDRE